MADPATWVRPCTNRDLFQVTCRGMTLDRLNPINLGPAESSSGSSGKGGDVGWLNLDADEDRAPRLIFEMDDPTRRCTG